MILLALISSCVWCTQDKLPDNIKCMQIDKITLMKKGGGDTDIWCNYINVGGDNNCSNSSTDNDDIIADNDHWDYCDNNSDDITITMLIT